MSSSSREIVEMLKGDGWLLVQGRGSHHHFIHPTKPGTIILPHPKTDLPKGTIRGILKAAGLA